MDQLPAQPPTLLPPKKLRRFWILDASGQTGARGQGCVLGHGSALIPSCRLSAEAAWTKRTFILCQPVVSGSELLVGGLVGHEHLVVLPEKVPPRWLGL